MSRPGFSKPQLDAPTSTFQKPFPIEVGSNLFRLVPFPDGHAAAGKWYAYHKLHFGYLGLKDNGETVARPFECPEVSNYKTKVVSVRCPECDLRTKREAELEQYKAGLQNEVNNGSKTLEEAQLLLQVEQSWLESHSVNKKYYIHVAKTTGEFGYLTIGYEAMESLKSKMKKVQEIGLDPFDFQNGPVFNFIRTGTGRFNTKYEVEIEMTHINDGGKQYMEYAKAPLTDAQVDAALPNMKNLVNITTTLPIESIKQLVESDGAPETVMAILNQFQPRATKPAASSFVPPKASGPLVVVGERSEALTPQQASEVVSSLKAVPKLLTSSAPALSAPAPTAVVSVAPVAVQPTSGLGGRPKMTKEQFDKMFKPKTNN